MKQILPWIVAGAVGAGAGFWLRGSQPENSPASAQAKARAIKESMGPPPGETVVHTFADDAQVKDFARIWQQRHAIVVRASALETYWNTEQTILGQLNSQLGSRYGLDATKTYTLNTDQRTLIERPAAESPEEAAAKPEAAASAAEQNVIHTFPDTEAMQVFAKLWQQRQAALTRMAVLRTYRDAEQAALTQLDGKLTSDYHMDLAKTYRLDETRHVLIELTPPAPTEASTAQPAQTPEQPAVPQTPAPTPAQSTSGK